MLSKLQYPLNKQSLTSIHPPADITSQSLNLLPNRSLSIQSISFEYVPNPLNKIRSKRNSISTRRSSLLASSQDFKNNDNSSMLRDQSNIIKFEQDSVQTSSTGFKLSQLVNQMQKHAQCDLTPDSQLSQIDRQFIIISTIDQTSRINYNPSIIENSKVKEFKIIDIDNNKENHTTNPGHQNTNIALEMKNDFQDSLIFTARENNFQNPQQSQIASPMIQLNNLSFSNNDPNLKQQQQINSKGNSKQQMQIAKNTVFKLDDIKGEQQKETLESMMNSTGFFMKFQKDTGDNSVKKLLNFNEGIESQQIGSTDTFRDQEIKQLEDQKSLNEMINQIYKFEINNNLMSNISSQLDIKQIIQPLRTHILDIVKSNIDEVTINIIQKMETRMNFNEVIMEEKVTKLKEKCDQQQTMIEILQQQFKDVGNDLNSKLIKEIERTEKVFKQQLWNLEDQLTNLKNKQNFEKLELDICFKNKQYVDNLIEEYMLQSEFNQRIQFSADSIQSNLLSLLQSKYSTADYVATIYTTLNQFIYKVQDNSNNMISTIQNQVAQLFTQSNQFVQNEDFQALKDYSSGFCHISHISKIESSLLDKIYIQNSKFTSFQNNLQEFQSSISQLDYMLLSKASKMDFEELKNKQQLLENVMTQLNKRQKEIEEKSVIAFNKYEIDQQNLDGKVEKYTQQFDVNVLKRMQNALNNQKSKQSELEIEIERKMDYPKFVNMKQVQKVDVSEHENYKMNLKQLTAILLSLLRLQNNHEIESENWKRAENSRCIQQLQNILQGMDKGNQLEKQSETIQVRLRPLLDRPQTCQSNKSRNSKGKSNYSIGNEQFFQQQASRHCNTQNEKSKYY